MKIRLKWGYGGGQGLRTCWNSLTRLVNWFVVDDNTKEGL